MQLLVIRHAKAELAGAAARSAKDDALRSLTQPGRRRMRRVAIGLRRAVPEIDLLATSPLKRAVQTAKIVARAYGQAETVTSNELSPNKRPQALLTWLQRQTEKNVVAIVGHEPHLSQCVGWFLTGLQESFIDLRKGGACLLDFPKEVGPGRAVLRWLMTPRELRRLAQGRE